MIKKNIKFVDFNGLENEETYYFNLNDAEIVKMTAKLGEDLEPYVNNLVANKDLKGIIDLIEDVILSSVGVKSEDGKTFVKTTQIRSAFSNSIAYSELFMELLENPKMTQDFISKMVAKPIKTAKESSNDNKVEESEVDKLRKKLAALEAN